MSNNREGSSLAQLPFKIAFRLKTLLHVLCEVSSSDIIEKFLVRIRNFQTTTITSISDNEIYIPQSTALALREKQDNVLMPFLNGSLVDKADDSSSKLKVLFLQKVLALQPIRRLVLMRHRCFLSKVGHH
jgi:hypothetical protein